MGPKKGSAKSPKKTPTPVVNKNWEAQLTKAPFEEDSWRTSISLLVGGSVKEEESIPPLCLAVQKPQRKLFSIVTWNNMIEKIRELGNPKSKKPDTPMFCEVTEPAFLLLEEGKELPIDLVVKVLKFMMLQIKAKDQQRRLDEQAEKERKAAPPVEVKEKPSGKGSKKGKADAPQVSAIEKKTKLKRRDDIDPPVYIDDEPVDGPQYYFLLAGFFQPQLIAYLNAIGISVANIIKMQSEYTSEEEMETSTLETDQNQNESSVEESEVEIKRKALFLFWASIRQILESELPDSKLNDTVQLSFIVPEMPPSHPENVESAMEYGNKIFDGVAKLIYECGERRRQHRHYRDRVKLVQVARAELEGQPIEEPPPAIVAPTFMSKKKGALDATKDTRPAIVSVDVDMRYYNDLLNLVCPEACSVALILHCMLEQVVISSNHYTPVPSPAPEENCPPQTFWLDPQLVGFMLQSFLPRLSTEEERLLMLNNLIDTVKKEEDKKKLMEKYGVVGIGNEPKKPLIIKHSDERSLRFRGNLPVHGFNPKEVEQSMIKMTPIWDLIQSVSKEEYNASCWMGIKQQLQHYCTDEALSWMDVEHFLNQSVFESMRLTTLDCCATLCDTRSNVSRKSKPEIKQPIIPWDDPLSYAKQQLLDLQNQTPVFQTEDPENVQAGGTVNCTVELSEIQNCRLRSLFEWHYSEHHNPIIFPQVLLAVTEQYRCLDTFRGSHNNLLYIYCHNPRNCREECKEFWEVKLHTDVKFRNYLEHVAETISDWTDEEEFKRFEKLRKSLEPPETPKDADVKPAEEEKPEAEPAFRKESLKAWKLEQERLREEELAKKAKKESSAKGKKDKDDKSAKKDTSPKGKKGKEKEKGPEKDRDSKSPGGKKSKGSDKKGKGSAGSTPSKADGSAHDANKDAPEEPFSGFNCYSFDGELIHVSGSILNVYPSDGGEVSLKKIKFLEGSSLLTMAVKKDGHQLYTHINQIVKKPKKCNAPKEDGKGSEPGQSKLTVPELVEAKTVKHGSFTAVLDDAVRLAYSFYGLTGEYTDDVPDVPNVPDVPDSPEVPPQSSGLHTDKEIEMESIPHEPNVEPGQECHDEPAESQSRFNRLNVSLPNGLFLQFMLEDAPEVPPEARNILVRQSFPMQGQGHLDYHSDTTLSKELSRTITMDGTVIRYMRDGSSEILFANGSVSFSRDSGPVWVPDSELPVETEDSVPTEEEKSESGYWCTTSLSGNRICTIGTSHEYIPTPPLLTLQTTDPVTHDVMLTREDLLVSVQNSDGSQIVEHADGTRISTILQNRLLYHPSHHFCKKDLGENSSVRSPSLWSEMSNGHFAESRNGSLQIHNILGNVHKSFRDIENPETGSTPRDMSECGCSNDGDRNFMRPGRDENDTSEKENKVIQERILLVEKEGCATVMMYPERQSAHIVLANGMLIIGNNRGEYEIFPASKGFLHIHSNGKYEYSTDQNVNPDSKPGSITNVPGTYTMNHTDEIACEIAEENGNHFKVTDDGEVSVRSTSSTSSILHHFYDDEDYEDLEEGCMLFSEHNNHPPRLFMVREDGSGTELLSSESVENLLQQAYFEPNIALLIEPLPDLPEELVITILKPCHGSIWSQWLLSKQNPNIIPPNLKNRSWNDFPRTEIQNKALPLFGSNAGIGLTLKEMCKTVAIKNQFISNCPDVLEMRKLYQHRSLTIPLKDLIDRRLKKYIEKLMEKQQHAEEMKVKDPRSEEENCSAQNLFSLVLSFAEEDDLSLCPENMAPETVVKMYNHGIGMSTDEKDAKIYGLVQKSGFFKDINNWDNQIGWIEKITLYREELSDEKIYKDALMKRSVVPYFHKENRDLYKNMDKDYEAAKDRMPSDPSTISKWRFFDSFVMDDDEEETPPPHLTAVHSKNHEEETKRASEKRPTHPTPGERRSMKRSKSTTSMKFDDFGKHKHGKVSVPKHTVCSKPCTMPNEQYLKLEEPVRRKCHTVSLSDPTSFIRGFQLHPSYVDFGVVLAGSFSLISVTMKNIGVDACRFHVKQPPPASGLRVIYTPGLVAAGLHVKLQVQLFAMQATDSRKTKTSIFQDIVIHTETDIHHLPVTAVILPNKKFSKEVMFSRPPSEISAFEQESPIS